LTWCSTRIQPGPGQSAGGTSPPILQLPNYTNNWLRLGYTTDDLAGGGSDRLVDGLVAWGTTEAIRSRIAPTTGQAPTTCPSSW